jgi:uncharacterized membrane protein
MTADRARDTRIEVLLGRVLRIGVVTSTICLIVGLAVSATYPHAGITLLNAGIVVLIATPAARVVLATVEYALDRDWTFALLTSIVLLELIAGAIAALVFHRKI